MFFPGRGLLCTCVLLLAASVPVPQAAAQDSSANFSYTYLDVSYLNWDTLDGSYRIDGYERKGVFAISDNLHIVAGYSTLKRHPPFFGVHMEADSVSYGLGFNHRLKERWDAYARASYIESRTHAAGNTLDRDYGHELSAGIRFKAHELVEVTAEVGNTDMGESDDTFVGIGAMYYIDEAVGVRMSLSYHDTNGKDFEAISIGARFLL